MANTTNVIFPAGLKISVQAFANAAYSQQVTITSPSGTAAIFVGNGEGNVPLTLKQAGFLTTSGGGAWPAFTAVSGNYVVAVSANGKPSLVAAYQTNSPTPGGGTMYLSEVVRRFPGSRLERLVN